MGTNINVGEQIIRWHWYIPMRSDILNERLYYIMPDGIYSGMMLSTAGPSAVQISSGVIQIRDDSKKVLLKCEVTEPFVLSGIHPSASYIYAHWFFKEQKEWYVNFINIAEQIGTDKIILSNYVCLGRAKWNPTLTTITGFDYSNRQEAKFVYGLSFSFIDNIIANTLKGDRYNIVVIPQTTDPNNIRVGISATKGGGDHSTLSNLLADDHTQYILADGTRPLGSNWYIGYLYGISAYHLSATGLSAGKLWVDYKTSAGLLFNKTILPSLCGGLSGAGGITISRDGDKLVIENNASVEGVYLSDFESLALWSGNKNINLFKQVYPSRKDNSFYYQMGYYVTSASNEVATTGVSAVTTKEIYIDANILSRYANIITRSSLTTHRYMGGGCSNRGFGYIVAGGSTTAASDALYYAVKYNDNLNVWSSILNLTTKRKGIKAFPGNNYLYAILGKDDSNNYNSNYEKYSIENNSWTTHTTTFSRYAPGLFSIMDDYNYIVGGELSNSLMDSVYQFDINSDTFVSKTAFPSGVSGAGGFNIEDYGYVIGGYVGGAGIYVNSILQYSPFLNVWTTRNTALPVLNEGITCLQIIDTAIIIGPGVIYPYATAVSRYIKDYDYFLSVGEMTSAYTYFEEFAQNGTGNIVGGLAFSGTTANCIVDNLHRKLMFDTLVEIPTSLRTTVMKPKNMYISVDLYSKNHVDFVSMKGLPIWMTTSATSGLMTAASTNLFGQDVLHMESGKVKSYEKYWNGTSTPLSAMLLPNSDTNLRDYRIRVGVPSISPQSCLTWYTIESIPSAIENPVANTTVNGFGYIFNEEGGYRYNPDLNVWSNVLIGRASPDSDSTSAIKSNFVLRGKIYSIDHKCVKYYHPSLNSWTSVSIIETSGIGSSGAAIAAEGVGHFYGGITSANSFNPYMFSYREIDNYWLTNAINNYGGQAGNGLFKINNNGFYSVGGMSTTADVGEINEVYIYSIIGGYWSKRASMTNKKKWIGFACNKVPISQKGIVAGFSESNLSENNPIEFFKEIGSSGGYFGTWLSSEFNPPDTLSGDQRALWADYFKKDLYIIGGQDRTTGTGITNCYKATDLFDSEVKLNVSMIVKEVYE